MERDQSSETPRTDEQFVDWVLGILKVKDRATLDALVDDPLFDPIGCGCCSWTPWSWYDSWEGKPTEMDVTSFRFATDEEYVMRLNERYEGE